MNNKRLGIPYIAFLNVKNSLTRSVGLVLLMAVLSFVLFGGAILSKSLSNGLGQMKDRLGADLMIVPVENQNDLEAVLLKGEPSCFYFKRTLEGKVAGLEGVSLCSSQFFLTSLEAECCDAKVQLIGFDPDTDFVIQPWIRKTFDGELKNGAVIVGNDIQTESGGFIKLFGKEYEIAAKLDATGTGLDQAVYATKDTILRMYADAEEKGQRFLEDADPKEAISAILVRVQEGYDRKTLIKNIRREIGGVKIVESQNMITGTADNMKNVAIFLYIFSGLFFLTSVATLLLVFSVISNERKKEFAVLRTLGATRKKLAGIILSESAIITGTGGLVGAIFAAIIIFPLNVYIGDRLGLPYLLPNAGMIAFIFLVDLVVSFLTGPLSAALLAVRISRAETYLTMREGE
ncbi:ABC transporter permease [Butyrivibrio sp. AE3004]|uniref:ABC transporter permease n=1 Tax=Butyrivibrio sp. AE3004 TaxID=1506994 RepID=UPI0004942FE1|nr:ABC transporter permease [Butyrivibrio sp. AE3004]